MKRLSLVLVLTTMAFSACRHVTVNVNDYSAIIGMTDGTLTVTPLDNNAIRVQFVPGGIELPQLENLIYTETRNHQYLSCSQNLRGQVIVSCEESNLRAVVNTRNGKITFKDSQGNVILSESARSRSVEVGKTGNFNSLAVSQSFITGPDEFLFGTGQFQDGYLNIRGLSRRLTQVNTQISIPMIISNKGYGILWNNYGLTDYNPSESILELQQGGSDGTSVTVNATGTAGNVRERRFFNDFNGELQITKSGD